MRAEAAETGRGGRGPVRVMVVDDSPFMRRALEAILAGAGDLLVCASVGSGEEALERLEASRPDVVTMDVEMPGIGGLATIRALHAVRPVPVVVVSSRTARGTQTSLRALEAGAADVVAKPAGGAMDLARVADEIVAKIRVLGAPSPAAATPAPRPAAPAADAPRFERRHPTACVAIGVSTGGPAALAAVCAALDPALAVPVLVVQHMPVGFTRPLAERLDAASRIEVVEARDGMALAPGRVAIGVAGRQLRVVDRGGALVLRAEEPRGESPYAPSADVLFASLAQALGRRVAAFVMTGMGHDGVEGLRRLKAAGAYVYAQDEASCVVYGMPRAAVLAGLVDATLPLRAVAAAIDAAGRGLVA